MVSVLLATFNGEKYISAQIESLLSQSFQGFKLYICDDRSTDGTFSVISDFAVKYPEKIFVSQNEENAGGAKYNFLKMMIDFKDDYVMLCDQDDVWLSDKIEKSLNKIKEMEEEFGSSIPILVHTDLTVVNDELNVISSSYEKMSNKDFDITSLNFAVTMNNVAGCTAIYNRALADLIRGVPDFIVMHDWWLSLTAAALGKIGAVHEPTVLYRQHKDNDSGAKRVLSIKYIYYVLTHLNRMAAMIDDSYKQAGVFFESFKDRLSEDSSELLCAYASIPGLSRWKRLRVVRKYRTFMFGFARKAAQVLILLVHKGQGIAEQVRNDG